MGCGSGGWSSRRARCRGRCSRRRTPCAGPHPGGGAGAEVGEDLINHRRLRNRAIGSILIPRSPTPTALPPRGLPIHSATTPRSCSTMAPPVPARC